MPISLLALALQASSAAACTYDRVAMLSLDEHAFDQDMTGGCSMMADAGRKQPI